MKFEASQSRQMSQQRQFLSPHPFARRYKTGAVPRPVSLKAAISAQTNAPERAESISGHPAPGTLRLGRTEPCHRLRIRTISAARAKPYAPAPFGCVRRKRRNNIPNSSGKNARALQFSERATVSADADAFDRPLRFRITRREGKDEHPLPLRFGKPEL